MARNIRLKLTLSRFSRDAEKFARRMESARNAMPRRITKALDTVGKEWEAGAKYRAPWDTGDMEADISRSVIEHERDFHELAVGTSKEYGIHVEFGTERIAGGAVLALGGDPEITDSQAITTWKALEEDGPKATGKEQMPWLRPSFWAMGDMPVDALADVVEKSLS